MNESLPTGSEEDYELLEKLYHDLTPTQKEVRRLAEEHTETFTFSSSEGDTRFNMVRFTPDDPDGSVILSLAEFGHGRKHTAGVIRALAMRALANPHATLLYQPNDTRREPNMNLSKHERRELKEGNYDAYARRFNAALEALPEASEGTSVLVAGLSQGATVAGKYAAHSYTEATETVLVEAPNVVNRSLGELGLAFASSGKKLKEVIGRNGYPTEDLEVTVGQDILTDLNMLGLLGYATELAHPTNLALAHSMKRATLEKDIHTAITKRQGAIVHAWADGDKVSPAEANRAIAHRLRLGEIGIFYATHEIPDSDHSITNDNLRMALLVREAMGYAA